MARILGTTRSQQRRIEKERELGHHIPDVLMDKASDLDSVRHKDELRRFCLDYRDRSFSNLEEEYECVKKSISNLAGRFFPVTLNSVIERGMRACLAAGHIDRHYRDHFIHPFQIFLSGSIIIDRFYEKFQRWYDSDLCSSVETCLESAWLLATIFHDRAKEVNAIRELLELETGPSGNKIPNEDRYIQLLSSFHKHRSAGNPLNIWNTGMEEDHNLTALLAEHSERWSHGVKGGILMLRHICESPENVSPRDIASASAIAVHDSRLWSDLTRHGTLPMRMDLFPLSCLLLYLDAVQEWGRHPSVDTEVRLANFTVIEQSVTFEVAFDSNRAARNKLEECERAEQCVLSNLELGLSVKVRLNR